jgi:hypothetical protein
VCLRTTELSRVRSSTIAFSSSVNRKTHECGLSIKKKKAIIPVKTVTDPQTKYPLYGKIKIRMNILV